MSGPLDFTNQDIETSYQRVLQTDGTDIYDGTGSLFTVTAVAVPAGPDQSIQFNDAGATSGSGNFTFDKNTNIVNLTGSIIASSGFTGSLLGTAATASNTPNAVITASIDLNTITFTKGDGSTFPLTVNTGSGTSIDTGSFVTTSSFNSFTSSYNTGSFTGSFSGSFYGTASWADSASQAISASYVLSSSYALSASHAESSSYALSSSYSLSSSFATSASWAANGGVTQLLAGPNVSLSPTNGLGQVTISSTGGGGGGNTATGSYGSFYDTTTQTNPVGNVPLSMSFNTTDITNGVSISGSTSPFDTYIKITNPGVYDIQFSAQLDKTDSGTDEIIIWLRKNGSDLTDTATTITLSGNNDKQVAAWNWFVNSAANDYYQIIWVSTDTGMRLLAEPISGTHPGIPSVILTVNRVDQFLSNTGSFTGSFTGELIGTASWATNALTSSFITASNVYGPYGSNSVLSSSYAISSSYSLLSGHAESASYSISSSYSLSSSYSVSSSYTLSSSYSLSSSYAESASYTLSSSYSLSSSYVESSSYSLSGSYALTASYALNAVPTDTGSLLTTASISSNIITFTKGDGSTFPLTVDTGSGSGGGNSTSLYVENTCAAGGLQQADICYVESSNAVFIANLSSNTVTAIDVTTNLILATIAVNPSVTSPNVIKYLPTINEVWVCGATNNLVRIDATAFTFIAAVALGGIGYNMIEYDATKAYILTAAGYKQFTYESMSITATIALNGAVSNSVFAVTLNNNPLSAQYDKIIIGSRNGLQILNPSTNTVSTVDTLGGDFTNVNSYRLIYSATEDAYYLATIFQSRFYKISITGATSFSQISIGSNRTHDLVIDDSVDTLLIIETLPAGGNVGVKNFKLSDLTIRKSEFAQIFGGASGYSGAMAIDTTRKKAYAVGRNANSNGMATLKYS